MGSCFQLSEREANTVFRFVNGSSGGGGRKRWLVTGGGCMKIQIAELK
jgi:hypothetical protein